MKHLSTAKAVLAAALAAALLALPVPARADWIDSWVQQKTGAGPNYFEGQQRGYFTAGAFSARVPTNRHYLLTAETPRLRSGCGGIDVFMGGLGFMNADMLVEKGQRIIQAAPFLAFDIALQTLAPQLSASMKALEAIANDLNSLALDECALGKEVLTRSIDFARDPAGSSAAMGEAANSFFANWMTAEGLETQWEKYKQKTRAAGGTKPANSSVTPADAVAGCPAEIREIFGTEGSLLARLASKTGLSAETGIVDALRGYLGDVIIARHATGFTASVMLPCPQNSEAGADNLLDGAVYVQSESGVCSPAPDANRNLKAWVSATTSALRTKLRGKGALTASEAEFIENSPAPVYLAIKSSIGAADEASVAGSLDAFTAHALAFNLVSDLYHRMNILVQAGEHAASAQGGGGPGCEIGFLQPPIQQLQALKGRLAQRVAGLRDGYMKHLKESQTVMTMVERYRSTGAALRSELQKRFGTSVAKRVMP